MIAYSPRHNSMKKKLLNFELHPGGKKIVLEKIEKYIKNPIGFYHIVSINPEIAVIAHKNPLFRKVVNTAQSQIIDGVGIVIAGQILRLNLPSRLTGVDLMQEVVSMAADRRLTVMLIGGRGNLADRLADCYNRQYPGAKFIGMEGIKNIVRPTKKEEDRVFSIVSATKPRILLVAFGSPYQELWLWRNRHKLTGIVCIGVGGAFDYISGRITRAPAFMRKLGLEWLYRLIRQPWRLKRQLRIIEFIYLILKQRLKSK